MAITIPQLPRASSVDSAEDLLVISQGGVTYSTTFAEFIAQLFTSSLFSIATSVAIEGFLALSSAVVTAAGSGPTSATPITASRVVVNNVAPGTGVILPDLTAIQAAGLPVSIEIAVLNRGANALAVYPQNGGQIETLQVDSPSGIAPGGSARFLFSPEGVWRIS